jgi:hypothetical protein
MADQHIIIDSDGSAWGPFESSVAAVVWATRKWPDQEHDEGHVGDSWYVTALTMPDAVP